MECRDFALQTDDYLDGRLDPVRQRSMQEHMEHCLSCRRRHQHATALQATLRMLPAPASRPGFVDRVLWRATGAAAGTAWPPRRAVSLALAAAPVPGGGGGGFFRSRPALRPVPAGELTTAAPAA